MINPLVGRMMSMGNLRAVAEGFSVRRREALNDAEVAKKRVVGALFQKGLEMHGLTMSKALELRREQKYLLDTYLYSLDAMTSEQEELASKMSNEYIDFSSSVNMIDDPEHWLEQIEMRLLSCRAELEHVNCCSSESP